MVSFSKQKKKTELILFFLANYFMNAYLHGLKDEDVMIRASSLSNLAELCKRMKFALNRFLVEILYAIEILLDVERDTQVRRACIFVYVLLFEGLGEEIVNMVELKEIRRIYRKLKYLSNGINPNYSTKLNQEKKDEKHKEVLDEEDEEKEDEGSNKMEVEEDDEADEERKEVERMELELLEDSLKYDSVVAFHANQAIQILNQIFQLYFLPKNKIL